MIRVLDTSIVIEALQGDAAILERLETMEDDEGILTAPVLGELLVGARKTKRPEDGIRLIEELCARMRFEPFGKSAAERYAALRAELEKRGRNATDFDLAIAAIALDLGAILVMHDGKFVKNGVPGLVVEDWVAEAQ